MTKLIIRFFIQRHSDTEPSRLRNQYGFVGGGVGVFCNVLLFFGKLLAGFLTASLSVMADAFNNLSDAASSIVALLGFKLADMPPDKEHPFGHGRFEYIAGFVVSVVIIIVGVELFKTSVIKIIHPTAIRFQWLSLFIMIVSIGVKLWMCLFYREMGKIIDSSTLKAAAVDSLNDVVATAAIVAGMLIYHFFDYNLDGYIGLFVACFIFYGGVKTAKETLDPLLGQGPDADFVEQIKQETLKNTEIYGVHDIIVHSYGPAKKLISLHVEISCYDDLLSIHDTIDAIEKRLANCFQCEAVIHMDPVAVDDEKTRYMHELAERVVASVDEILSIHDFRLMNVDGKEAMVFDIAAPFKYSLSDESLKAEICNQFLNVSDNYKAIIHIDRTF